jgi:hypothetical protein
LVRKTYLEIQTLVLSTLKTHRQTSNKSNSKSFQTNHTSLNQITHHPLAKLRQLNASKLQKVHYFKALNEVSLLSKKKLSNKLSFIKKELNGKMAEKL